MSSFAEDGNRVTVPLSRSSILVDGREFSPDRFTGIGRVVEGLVDALLESATPQEIHLAVLNAGWVPLKLKRRRGIRLTKLPRTFLAAERSLSNLTRSAVSLFISPYPKLPLFGVHCRAVHIIHDVLDLTHLLYKTRFRGFFDRYRLRKALHRADLTWYDSSWSMRETQKHFGFPGRYPKVRYPGLEKSFQPEKQIDDESILDAYGLKPGYVLALGNGKPHKNLGIILDIAHQLERPIVFAGVSGKNRQYWESRHSGIQAVWISHVVEKHLPVLFRGSFCLVQPSLVEGYGYPSLEAMACGRPAIVSRIPVLVETTGNCALSAPPNEPTAWRDALNALENTARYDEVVEKGLRWTEPLRGRRAWRPYLADIENLMKGS